MMCMYCEFLLFLQIVAFSSLNWNSLFLKKAFLKCNKKPDSTFPPFNAQVKGIITFAP